MKRLGVTELLPPSVARAIADKVIKKKNISEMIFRQNHNLKFYLYQINPDEIQSFNIKNSFYEICRRTNGEN